MENSIEKDIVKKFEELCENWYVFKDDDMGGHFEGVVGDQRANTMLGYLIFKEELEDFLSDYKRVLKENEELNKKVKDIIDRIDYDIKKTKEIISKNTNIYASYRKNDYQIVRLRAMNTKSLDIKKRLQELLEGRK